MPVRRVRDGMIQVLKLLNGIAIVAPNTFCFSKCMPLFFELTHLIMIIIIILITTIITND